MQRPRIPATTRRMMAVVALVAMALWVGRNQSRWRDSFSQWRVNAIGRFDTGTTNPGEGVADR